MQASYSSIKKKKKIASIQFAVRRCSISREAKRPLKKPSLQIAKNGFSVEEGEGESME